jgi:hypothetical protein
LHQKCAPLFLRDNQKFVWGQDLKKSLGRINEYYLQMPEDVKEKGVISFSNDLPEIQDSLIENLWNSLMPKVKDTRQDGHINELTEAPPTREEIVGMENAPTILPGETDFDPLTINSFLFKRNTRKVRGSWRQLPD